jgi:hypothetical protein
MPDRISKVLGIVSGLSIVWIGGMMLWRRAKALTRKRSRDNVHLRAGHRHHPDGHTHEPPRGDLSMGSLMALGASGGLVPCPSALILLLSAISIGRPGLGVILLVVFSLGLALVLMSTGLVVLNELTGAERAASGRNGDFAQAFRALLRRGVGRRRLLDGARDQNIHRQHDKIIDGDSDQEKRNHGVNEIAHREFAAVDGELNRGEIRFADNRGDDRREQVFREGGHDASKRGADHDANRQIHYIAA